MIRGLAFGVASSGIEKGPSLIENLRWQRSGVLMNDSGSHI